MLRPPSNMMSSRMIRKKNDPKYQSVQYYHTTTVPDRSAVAVVLGLGALSIGSYAASTAISAYKEYQQHQQAAASASAPNDTSTKNTHTKDANTQDSSSTDTTSSSISTTTSSGGRSSTSSDGTASTSHIFTEWFGIYVGAKCYEGGFEDVMTRREAALILGVRESSTSARIKDEHRKLLIINHPDTGGSTYLTGKINEAKELLLKGLPR
jgi:hypothetical protein